MDRGYPGLSAVWLIQFKHGLGVSILRFDLFSFSFPPPPLFFFLDGPWEKFSGLPF
jgi:hypothetical protein